MSVAIWNDAFTTSTETVLRFPHPTEPAGPSDYEAHLLNIREPIPDSEYQAYQRVIKQRFTDPDRNGDDMIDIADLVTRMEEAATTWGLLLGRPE